MTTPAPPISQAMQHSNEHASPGLDPRTNAFRPDLAAEDLRGLVEAPRFASGTEAQVVRASVPVRAQPDGACGLVTEMQFGERVDIFDENDGWAWVQSRRDKYVGYVPTRTLSKKLQEPTHRVRALGTFIYPQPDIKTTPLTHLSINSLVTAIDMVEDFHQLESGGFISARHIAPLDRHARDFVEVAERFIGTPYLWGGRTRVGIDCSGLVQVALEAAGQSAPRDTDMQQEELGTSMLVPDDLEGLQRGDLIFWKGHVGIMSDGIMMVHANAHHMAVTVETLPEAVERIGKSGSTIAAIKRF